MDGSKRSAMLSRSTDISSWESFALASASISTDGNAQASCDVDREFTRLAALSILFLGFLGFVMNSTLVGRSYGTGFT